ncbi:hypothetical protein MRB53_015639 [Persea americana]|uniref:Uncharacterized protein n=1 Tax=Persea americana TaxID=3435 RepID=A0ACC2LZV4_PERAE|nr:hypothetical protein MRB53_015639 [Persea americana]
MDFKARVPRFIFAFAIIALFFIGASAARNIPSPINEPVHVVADNFNNNDKDSYHPGPDLPDEEVVPNFPDEPVHVVADNFNNNDKDSYHQGPDLPDEEEVPEWEDFKKLAQKEIEKEEREYMLNYLNK